MQIILSALLLFVKTMSDGKSGLGKYYCVCVKPMTLWNCLCPSSSVRCVRNNVMTLLQREKPRLLWIVYPDRKWIQPFNNSSVRRKLNKLSILLSLITNYSSVYSIYLFYLSIYLTILVVVGVPYQRVSYLAEGYS